MPYPLTHPATALFSTRMCVAQLYIPNPYLLGAKAGSVFRLRTFALITSVHPHMRAFLYREGVSSPTLVRVHVY